MRVLQANMHRSKVADALIDQIAIEKQIDVAIISEQYKRRKNGTYYDDENKTAAIWLPRGSRFVVTQSGAGNGHVYVKSKSYTVMSCYLTPSDSIEEFQTKLDLIEDQAQEIQGPLVIGGDFNSQAIEWGMSATNSRGRRVLDLASRLGLIVANIGSVATFRRPGCIGTIPDITLVSEQFACNLKEWRVIEDFTGSDHQYITYHISPHSSNHQGSRSKSTRKWNEKKLKIETLVTTIDQNPIARDGKQARELVSDTIRCIITGCNAAMPKISTRYPKKAVYWWTEEIGQLRSNCHSKRRLLTRARRRGIIASQAEAEAFKDSRKKLKLAIERSKRQKWEQLRNDLNSDPWGLGYKIVMKKIGGRAPTPEMEPQTMRHIVDTLFPTHELHNHVHTNVLQEEPQQFTQEELQLAARSLKAGKAPGPDGIPAETLKVIALHRPRMLLDMYNACLAESVFPERWKKQMLTLISKGKGNPTEPSAYRPLCMLDSAGKLLEKLIKGRLKTAVESSGGLSDRQHGFRAGRSTIGAIEDVINTVAIAQQGHQYSKRIVLLATLDVRNAFNSLKWADVIDALSTRFRVPEYLLRMIKSYLKDRVLLYNTSSGQASKQITAGAAQGSILGPDIWNITYDEILRIEMPTNSHLVGYADDIAALITARDATEAQQKLNEVMLRTQAWLDKHGLSLATEKTEIIFLTNKHMPLEVDIRACNTSLTTKRAVKYLGLKLDCRLNFWAQIQHAATRASRIVGMLSKLMANVRGPTQSKRKLLMTTTNSVMLYGSEIWADALQKESRRKILLAVQRTSALRVASAYRTVSGPAVMVISGTIPIDLLAIERKRNWEAKRQDPRLISAQDLRRETLQNWQRLWEAETRGRWTARLIPNLGEWYDRKFGEVNYYLTQLLSGHGYFREYLYRMGKTESANCLYDTDIDTAEHTFFECAKWQNEREIVQHQMGRITPDNITELMRASEENWISVSRYVYHVLKHKKRDLDAGHQLQSR